MMITTSMQLKQNLQPKKGEKNKILGQPSDSSK